MSFSTEVKDNIINLKFKNKCCKKSFLYGAAMGAEIADGRLSIKMTHKNSAAFTAEIAKNIFKVKDLTVDESKRGAICTTALHFSLPTAVKLLSDIDSGVNVCDELDEIFSCNSCASYFFAGAFCSCGSVSDPQKSYTAELLFHNKNRAMFTKNIFEGYTDLTPGMCKKSRGYSVYFRNGDGVAGLLTLFQINTVVFDFLNQQFENQLRFEEQRATNCVAKNIQKSVSASSVHTHAIQKLIDHDKFYLLSDELMLTAKLRIENPELSLKALASLHTPPITKSGLNHRLEKIIKISEELTED